MDLVILRHGDALRVSDDGRDWSRKLSDRGKSLIEEVSNSLLKSGVIFDVVITSPFTRAIQTSYIILEKLKINKIFESDLLLPYASPQQAKEYIFSFKNSNVIAVSHLPLVSYLSFLLIQKDFYFHPGSYIHIKNTGEDFEIISKYMVE